MAEQRLYLAVENSSMTADAQDDAATAMPLMAIAPPQERTPATLNLDDHLYLPQADRGTDLSVQTVFPLPPGESVGEGGRAWAHDLLPLTPVLSPWERETKGMSGPVSPLLVGPIPPADETFGAEPVAPSHGLNAVQIEHIIDALAERLELMLIRAYGTTGA
jgi:hypothetical protein